MAVGHASDVCLPPCKDNVIIGPRLKRKRSLEDPAGVHFQFRTEVNLTSMGNDKEDQTSAYGERNDERNSRGRRPDATNHDRNKVPEQETSDRVVHPEFRESTAERQRSVQETSPFLV